MKSKHLQLMFMWFAFLTAQSPCTRAQEVRLPNQEYTESHTDLSVATLAGPVQLRRTWVSGRWYINPAWADLRLHPDPMGGILAVERAGSVYQRTGSNAAGEPADGTIYQFDENNFIAKRTNGWRWYDRLGNSLDYDNQGRTQGYGDANGNRVRLVRSTDGQLNAVQDQQGRTVLTLAYDGNQRLVQATDIANHSVSYQWSGNQLSQVTDASGHTWRYAYDSMGQITSRTNPAGKNTRIVYASAPRNIPATPGFAGVGGGSGGGGDTGSAASSGSTRVRAPEPARVAGYTDESGATWNYRLEYNRARREYNIDIQRPDASRVRRVYDRDGWLLYWSVDDQPQYSRTRESTTQEKISDARGLVTVVQRNAAQQITKTIHPDGSVETTSYDGQGRAVRHVNPLGVATEWKYDSHGNLSETVQAVGRPEQRTSRYERDAYGYITRATYGSGEARGSDARTDAYTHDDWGCTTAWTNPLGQMQRYTCNARGQTNGRTDALGRTWQTAYDAKGRLTQSTDPLGKATRIEYGPIGELTRATSPLGYAWQYQYDVAGRVTRITNPLGQSTQLAYDGAGRLSRYTSPSGLTVLQASYDGLARITQVQDAAGNTTRYEYGGKDTPLAGLLTAIAYPTYRETYAYDQRGRQTAITQHLDTDTSRTTRQAWNAAGQRISTIDPAGHTTLYQYDALGRLTQITDALAQTTRYAWDGFDRLARLTDANGNTHRFEYDLAGRLAKEIRPMGGAIGYSYDAAGQFTERTDAAGHTRTYQYDGAGRLTGKEHKLQGTSLDERITYEYDQDGRLTGYAQTDGSGAPISSVRHTLDALGRATRSDIRYGTTDGQGAFDFAIGQGFDHDGQIASHTYPDGSQQSYGYSQGRLSQIRLPNQAHISYRDYNWRTPGQMDVPGATKTIHSDALQRPESITVRGSANQILASRAYQYDPAGNITQIDSDLGQTRYGYDQLNRLIQAHPDNALQAMGLPQEQYSYDAVGNRTASAHQPGTWVYNQDNQLVQYPRTTSLSQTPAVDTQVTYTLQGHASQESNQQGTERYGYNAAERLVHYTETPAGQSLPSVEAQYWYDPFGRRIAKTVKHGSVAETTYYLYNDNGLMAEADGQGKITKAYGFNPQAGLWSTDPVWQAQVSKSSLTDAATDYHYLHNDHLRTPVLATDNRGETSWKAVAQAFGATGVLPESVIAMHLRFPGQYFDGERGGHYNFHRDYRADLGRYLQSDPIGVAGGENFFLYVNGNPLSWIDPRGLQVVPTPIGPVPIGPIPVIPPGSGDISYPPPDFDPWRDGRPEVVVPILDPRIPKGPRPPNDPEGGGACRRMLEACLQATKSKFCPAPAKPPLAAICFAAYAGCMMGTGGD